MFLENWHCWHWIDNKLIPANQREGMCCKCSLNSSLTSTREIPPTIDCKRIIAFDFFEAFVKDMSKFRWVAVDYDERTCQLSSCVVHKKPEPFTLHICEEHLTLIIWNEARLSDHSLYVENFSWNVKLE